MSRVKHLILFLQSFIILLSVLGCASQMQQVKPVKSKKPAWIDNGRHPGYPESLYISGLGLASLSVDPVKNRSLADANALGEIVKQIEARIQVRDVHITVQHTISGESHGVTVEDSSISVSEIYSDLILQGLSIVDRYIDFQDSLVYALATLDREKAVSVLKQEIEQLQVHYDGCIEKTDDLFRKNRFLRSLWYAKEAGIAHSLGTERLKIARFIMPVGFEGAESKEAFGSPIVPLTKAEEIISGLILEKEGGDGQKVKLGTVPKEPFSIGLYFLHGEKKVPVSGALIRFDFQQGKGNLADSVYTNQHGSASSRVYELEPLTQSSYEVSASLNLSPLVGHQKDLPDSWRSLFGSAEKRIAFRFDMEADDVEAKAKLLAMNLAQGLPDDTRIPLKLVISNLTYQDIRISSPFLGYFQEQIAMRLSQLPKFQVIKGTELREKIRTRSISVTEKKTPDTPEGIKDLVDADAVLVGKCWEKEENISIMVDIIESSSKAALSSSSSVIQKDLIPSNLPLLPVNYKEIQQNMDVWDDQYSPNSKLDVKVWVDHLDGGVYQEGEKMQAYVWVNKDCYLYLIYHSVNGNDLLIFPNQYRQSNHLIGNTVYEIPGAMDHFDFTVVPPCGVEILKAFASTHPMPELQGEAVGGGIKHLKLSTNALAKTLRDVSVTGRIDSKISNINYLVPSGPVERAEASCVVTTVRKY